MNPEMAAVTAAYHAAVVRLGAEVIIDAIRLFARLNPTGVRQSGDGWIQDATALALSQHRAAHYLAVSYYRLMRALATGTTVRDEDDTEAEVTLGELREDFAELVRGLPPESAYTPPADGNSDRIITVDEDFVESARQIADREAAAIQQAAVQLQQVGIDALEEKIEALDLDDLSARELEEAREEFWATAEKQQAAVIERVGMNGARGTVHNAMENDSKLVAWVRISTTGTPCGFCAMLISRGAVYKSQESAGDSEDRQREILNGKTYAGDEYHNNCKCIAVPVYDIATYRTDPAFAQNRELSQMWKDWRNGRNIPDGLEKDDDSLWDMWQRHFRRAQAAERANRRNAQVA